MTGKLHTNPMLRVHCGSGENVVAHPPSRRRFVVGDDVVDLLFFVAQPRTEGEVLGFIEAEGQFAADEARVKLNHLIAIELLVKHAPAPYAGWLDNGWRAALDFHLMTRSTKFIDMGRPGELAAKRATLEQYAAESLPELFKTYGEGEQLPPPEMAYTSTGGVLLGRRTRRVFRNYPLSRTELATILHYACQPMVAVRRHVRDHADERPQLLVLSSYTQFEVYFVASCVEGLTQGAYHYDMDGRRIHRIRQGDFRDQMKTIAIGQGVDGCSAVFLLTSRFERYMWRYRNSRALRNLYIECGALAHRLILSTVAVGLDAFITPAIRDSNADDILGVDGSSEATTYLVGVGR